MLTLHYQSRFGLARAALYRDGQPYLYAEGLEHDPALSRLGVRSVARLKGRSGQIAFLALADGTEAMADIAAKLTEGAAVEIEIVSEARTDKLARARILAPAEGTLRRLSPVMSLKDRLLTRATAIFGDLPVTDSDEEDALDTAEDAALDPSGPLPGGGYLHIEPTRALIACDVDGGDYPPKAVNERAVADLPRRLRLANLGGLVVVDLIGRRHDAARLSGLLMTAFAGEAASIIPAPIGKFGTLEFVRPWGAAPLTATDPHLRAARRLLGQAAARAESEPGRLLTLRAPQAVIETIRPLLTASHDALSAILRLQAGPVTDIVT